MSINFKNWNHTKYLLQYGVLSAMISVKTRGMKLEINYKENWKIRKYVEIKKHTLIQPIGQRRNHKGNYIIRGKWKWKHSMPTLWDVSKAELRGKFMAVN